MTSVAGLFPALAPRLVAGPVELRARLVQYHRRCRADVSPARWELNLGVWHEGTLVGTQGISTRDYLVTRTGETGSWLGLEHQGRGIGTAMRRADCTFAFDHPVTVEGAAAFRRFVGLDEAGTDASPTDASDTDPSSKEQA